MYLYRIHAVTFLPFRAYNTDNQLIIDTLIEALRRWSSAKAQKKELVEKMRKMLYEDYKARTVEEPLTFNVL